MAIKDVFLISKYTDKNGEEKTLWEKCGISFGTNKDGSINFKLSLFPAANFQIRDRKEKEDYNNPPIDQDPNGETPY